MNTSKIQTREYQNRHAALRGAFFSGYINQNLKPLAKTKIRFQEERAYSLITALKTILHCDISSPKLYEYMYVLGAIHADDLTITAKNATQIEAVAMYDYYNNLYVDDDGKPYYLVVDNADPDQDHEIVHTPMEYTPSQFKEILINEHISIGSSMQPGTLYSWFYKEGLWMDDENKYPAYIYARVMYMAVCNGKVKLLNDGIKKTEFYTRITSDEPNQLTA